MCPTLSQLSSTGTNWFTYSSPFLSVQSIYLKRFPALLSYLCNLFILNNSQHYCPICAIYLFKTILSPTVLSVQSIYLKDSQPYYHICAIYTFKIDISERIPSPIVLSVQSISLKRFPALISICAKVIM